VPRRRSVGLPSSRPKTVLSLPSPALAWPQLSRHWQFRTSLLSAGLATTPAISGNPRWRRMAHGPHLLFFFHSMVQSATARPAPRRPIDLSSANDMGLSWQPPHPCCLLRPASSIRRLWSIPSPANRLRLVGCRTISCGRNGSPLSRTSGTPGTSRWPSAQQTAPTSRGSAVRGADVYCGI